MSTNNKIKVCYILSHFTQGGAERQILNLIMGLNKNCYEITLLIYSSSNIFYREVLEFDINLVIFNNDDKNKFYKNLSNAFIVWNFLRKNKFDLIHTPLYHNGFLVRILAPKYYQNRILYAIRDNFEHSSGYYKKFEKLLIRNSFVVTNSLKSRNKFIEYVGKKKSWKVFNIYNGFDINKFSYNKDLNANNNLIKIGTIGRHIKEKNQIQILRVFELLFKKYKLELQVIGNITTLTNELRLFVETHNLNEKVQILDAQTNIQNFYRSFDVFILSSFHEGTPNVIFEAMLSGCVCIISQSANSDDFVIDGENGFVYDGTDEMLLLKLERAINMLLKGEVDCLIDNAKSYVKNNYSNEIMVNNYEQIYNYIISI
jgi:glycosyltransferase involved in cell wall biosynthesis